jgi:methylmalonyl-CoA mutase
MLLSFHGTAKTKEFFMPETDRLFPEFAYPTYEEWRHVAEQSLKGASFEKKLLSKTYETIDIQPLYRREDIEHLTHCQTLPGFPPYVRGIHPLGYREQPWDICQEIPYAIPTDWNRAARADLERGQTALLVVCDAPTRQGTNVVDAKPDAMGQGGVSISTLRDVAQLFEGISIADVPCTFKVGACSLPIAALFLAHAHQQQGNLSTLRGGFACDPLGTLAEAGNLAHPISDSYDGMAQLTQWVRANAPNMHTIAVQGHPYHNGGGSSVQELGFAIATGVAYIRAMQERGISLHDTATSMRFYFSIGSNFFMEVAKLRAARLIWAKVVEAFGGDAEAQKMVIHARTSQWNKTIYDPYVNMLRTTTESFAAVAGGCNSMHVGCFDETFQEPSDFSRRIARNTHIILQDECHLTKIVDPAGGSWYVEYLTDAIAKKAWEVFQEVERRGGMLAALEEGYPQQSIADVAAQRAMNIAHRRDQFIGTNIYANGQENRPKPPRAADIADATHSRYEQRINAFTVAQSSVDQRIVTSALNELTQCRGEQSAQPVGVAIKAALAGATLGQLKATLRTSDLGPFHTLQPITLRRGTEPFEQLRAASEEYQARTGKRPTVFLANIGPIPQHKPRADFSTGFFEVGGFTVLTNDGFATAEEAADAAVRSGAPVVTICSTDETYPDVVPPLVAALKQQNPDAIVVLAGYPKDQIEAHKAAGVDEYIHLRSNCYETLATLQKRIGV